MKNTTMTNDRREELIELLATILHFIPNDEPDTKAICDDIHRHCAEMREEIEQDTQRIAELEKDAARYQTVLVMGYKDYQEKCAALDLKVRSFADYVQQYNKTIDSPTGDA